MANKGYCTLTDVDAWLGRTLTGDPQLVASQQAVATTYMGAAEALIDRETRRAWLVPPVTAERHDLIVPEIYLTYAPVTSIALVQTRTTAIGDTPVTLTANVDYELQDASRGLVRIVPGYFGRHAYALVSYTPNLPVPADITLAAAMIVGQSMMLNLFPDRWGIARAQLDAQTSIQYPIGELTLSVPDAARRILDGYTRPLIV